MDAENTVDWTRRHIHGIGDLGRDTMAKAVDGGGDEAIAEVIETADAFKRNGMQSEAEQLLKDAYANVKNPTFQTRLMEAGNRWYNGQSIYGEDGGSGASEFDEAEKAMGSEADYHKRQQALRAREAHNAAAPDKGRSAREQSRDAVHDFQENGIKDNEDADAALSNHLTNSVRGGDQGDMSDTLDTLDMMKANDPENFKKLPDELKAFHSRYHKKINHYKSTLASNHPRRQGDRKRFESMGEEGRHASALEEARNAAAMSFGAKILADSVARSTGDLAGAVGDLTNIQSFKDFRTEMDIKADDFWGGPKAYDDTSIHGQLKAAGEIVSALGSGGGAGLGAKAAVSQILPKLVGLGQKSGQVAGIIADVGINPLAGGIKAANTARQEAVSAGKSEAAADAAARQAFIESYISWGTGKAGAAGTAGHLKTQGKEKLAETVEDAYTLVSDYRVQDLVGFLSDIFVPETGGDNAK